MKIRLHSITLDNFKGLSGKHEIDLANSLTLLYGPNGYGKTTIFDGIELALTGQISRINKSINENKLTTHKTSVVHNEPDRSVIVELSLSINNDRYTIKRTLDTSTDQYRSSRNKRLEYTWEGLKTSVIQNHPDGDKPIEESDPIATIFQDKGNYIKNHFEILSYLPQEDATFMLKRSQIERHSIISGLIDTASEQAELNKIAAVKTGVSNLLAYIEGQLDQSDEVEASKVIQTPEYVRIFDNKPQLDEKRPFADLSLIRSKEVYTTLLDGLYDVSRFCKQFSPVEYKKSKLNEKISDIHKDDSILDYIVFKQIDEKMQRHIGAVKDIVDSLAQPGLVEKFLLRDVLSKENFSKLKSASDSVEYYRSLLFLPDGSLKSVKKILTSLSQERSRITPETRQSASGYLEKYKGLETNLNSSQAILARIKSHRDGLLENQETHLLPDSDCLLCGHSWDSKSDLADAIDRESDYIEKIAGKELRKISEFEIKIKSQFLDEIEEKAIAYIDENKDDAVKFKSIELYGSITENELILFSRIEEMVGVDKLLKTPSLPVDDLSQKAEAQKQAIIATLPNYDPSIIEILHRAQGYDYTTVDDTLSLSGLDLSSYSMRLDSLDKYSVGKLKETRALIRQKIDDFLIKNKVNPDKIVDDSNMYASFFSEDEDKFNHAVKNIDAKIDYIKGSYSNHVLVLSNSYKGKKSSLEKLKKRIDSYHATYKNELTQYEKSIASPLKIPFYIYTSKILQNTPRGQGVFISTDKSSGSVVFKTSRDTSHDAVHQLSSGQLAVTSLAFHLAANLVYSEVSPKLLIIDDPIQDMDSLNIHSLSELLRREFAGKYQIIMSTHDDRDMNYLAYMMSKNIESPADNIRAINVQKTFYP